MKKFSILLGMLLYAFAWMINSVSASSYEITFPDSSKYGYKLDANQQSITEDGHSAGFSFTNASAGDYKIEIAYAGKNSHTAIVKKNQETSGTNVYEGTGQSKTFTLQPGDTLIITLKDADFIPTITATITISVPAPTPTNIPTDTPTPTSIPTDTPTPTSIPTDTPTPTNIPTDTPTPTSISTDIPTPTPTFAQSSTPMLTFTPTSIPTSTSEIPVILEDTAVPTAYIYPEDETGQYYLNADGNKIYCSFTSYELCLYYMGKPELCERYRR